MIDDSDDDDDEVEIQQAIEASLQEFVIPTRYFSFYHPRNVAFDCIHTSKVVWCDNIVTALLHIKLIRCSLYFVVSLVTVSRQQLRS